MKSKFFLSALFCLPFFSNAQKTDTLVTLNKTILASIKEVTPDQVAYVLPGMDVLYRINKSDVIRISYASGRVEESKFIKQPLVKFPEDWQKVLVVDQPVEGIYKVGNVNVSASRYNWFHSNRFKLRAKATRELQMVAAMLGGNVVYLQSQTSGNLGSHTYLYPVGTGNHNYGYYGSTTNYGSVETINGAVYTTQLPDTASFRKLAAERPTCRLYYKMKMRYYNGRLAPAEFAEQVFDLTSYSIENNQIIVHQKLKGIPIRDFRVNYFDNTKILLSYQNGVSYYVLAFLLV